MIKSLIVKKVNDRIVLDYGEHSLDFNVSNNTVPKHVFKRIQTAQAVGLKIIFKGWN